MRPHFREVVFAMPGVFVSAAPAALVALEVDPEGVREILVVVLEAVEALAALVVVLLAAYAFSR